MKKMMASYDPFRRGEIFKILSTCKGGGYKYCRTEPPHPKANPKGLYPLHRVIMENKEKRILEYWEDVHFKDHNKNNCTSSNLEIMTHAKHARHHHAPRLIILCKCPVCSYKFMLKKHQFDLRMGRKKFGEKLCCSRSCGVRYSYMIKKGGI